MNIPTLPPGITLQDFDGDLLTTGPGLNAERYREILGTMAPEIQERFIGWRHDNMKKVQADRSTIMSGLSYWAGVVEALTLQRDNFSTVIKNAEAEVEKLKAALKQLK